MAETGEAMSRRRFVAGAAGLGAAGALGVTAQAGGRKRVEPATATRMPKRLSVPTRKEWKVESVGSSVQGRSIDLFSNRAAGARAKVMIVSAIHGDERGAGAIGQHLATVDVPDGVDCYAIPIANPDGWAAGTRNNANDVDLNRNFPVGWRSYDGGRGALTEPEAAVVADAVARIRPDIIAWIHQPLFYVAPVNAVAEPWARIWADASGVPFRENVYQSGGGETWAGLELGCASLLVEAPTRDASPEHVYAHRRGFDALLAAV